MYRRDFLKQSAAALAVSSLPALRRTAGRHPQAGRPHRHRLVWKVRSAAADPGRAGRRRVALRRRQDGCSSDAADLVATRQASKKKPRTYSDYREMLAGEGPRHRAHRHARSLARAADDRGGQGRRRRVGARSRSASTSSKARRCWRRRGSTSAWCRSGCSGAARRTWSTRATASSSEGKLGNDRPRRDLLLLPHARDRESARHGAAGESRLRDVDRARADAARTTSWCIRAAGARSWNTATASSATCACTCSTWCAG